jgi:fructoselysine-6-P-deglycase FrlB-like protein
MEYQMYQEILEQPGALRKTFKEEKVHMAELAAKMDEFDKIYLIGCGSSFSTCCSAKSAVDYISNKDIDVYTGYEFVYNKNTDYKNSAALLTSQSGETADTLAALRLAKQSGVYTVSITNELNSKMAHEADTSIITRGGTEKAILGTKTYTTQLMCLYNLLFQMHHETSGDKLNIRKNVLRDIRKLPNITEDLIKRTQSEGLRLGEQFKDEELFYCMGSGPNYGLAYKLAMTMFMEGALKHACPVYSGEFRHGLIERAEKNVPIIFLDADYPGDKITKNAIEFGEKLGTKSIVYNMHDYSNMNSLMSPFTLVIPLEWFIYYLAHFNGEDPGETRHIGKIRYS